MCEKTSHTCAIAHDPKPYNSCASQSECPDDSYCNNENRCEKQAPSPAPVSPTSVKAGSQCYSVGSCPLPMRCVQGTCQVVTPCDASYQCSSYQYCSSEGYCKVGPQDPAYRCESGDADDCPDDQHYQCMNDICIVTVKCDSYSACDPGELCKNGVCTPQTCTTSDSCAGSKKCTSGVCVDGIDCTNSPCPPRMYCDYWNLCAILDEKNHPGGGSYRMHCEKDDGYDCEYQAEGNDYCDVHAGVCRSSQDKTAAAFCDGITDCGNCVSSSYSSYDQGSDSCTWLQENGGTCVATSCGESETDGGCISKVDQCKGVDGGVGFMDANCGAYSGTCRGCVNAPSGKCDWIFTDNDKSRGYCSAGEDGVNGAAGGDPQNCPG